MITLERVSIRDNYSSSHAGGILLFGSNMTAVDCEVVNVRSWAAEGRGRGLEVGAVWLGGWVGWGVGGWVSV